MINKKVTERYHKVSNPAIKTWDFNYYRNEYNLDFTGVKDDNYLRNFFPLEHVKT